MLPAREPHPISAPPLSLPPRPTRQEENNVRESFVLFTFSSAVAIRTYRMWQASTSNSGRNAVGWKLYRLTSTSCSSGTTELHEISGISLNSGSYDEYSGSPWEVGR